MPDKRRRQYGFRHRNAPNPKIVFYDLFMPTRTWQIVNGTFLGINPQIRLTVIICVAGQSKSMLKRISIIFIKLTNDKKSEFH